MKGIKEKSFELFPEMHTDSDDWDVIEEQCDRDKQRKAFVKGANYVLGEIEKLIYEKHVEGNLPLFDLTHLIDKLKEKSYGKRK